MNLFILHLSPKKCAKYYFDSHVVKIILEAVQLLWTAKQTLEPDADYDDCALAKKYKITHINHPVAIWVRESRGNWDWTCKLVKALLKEWRYRYDHPEDKIHGCEPIFNWLYSHPPSDDSFGVDDASLTDFAQAMPDIYKSKKSAIRAYRRYYMGDEKAHLRSWKKRGMPSWFKVKDE